MASTHTVRRLEHHTGFTLIELMIVILIIGILLAIAVPNFVSARETARARACVSNLKELDSATEQYAMDNHLDGNTTITPNQFLALAPTYLRAFPTCPEGGHYTPGATLEEDPSCSVSSGATALGGLYAPGQLWYHGL